MKVFLVVYILVILQNNSYGGYLDDNYKIKITSETEVEACLKNLNEIITLANVVMLSKGGSLKITEISANVSKELRSRIKCNYDYTALGTLSKQDGKQEQVTLKGKAYGDCIKK